MNSRRLMPGMGTSPYALSACQPSCARFLRTSNLPQGDRQVLGANLNCSE
jgi:hypothetical protein